MIFEANVKYSKKSKNVTFCEWHIVCPFNKQDVDTNFSWQDAYGKLLISIKSNMDEELIPEIKIPEVKKSGWWKKPPPGILPVKVSKLKEKSK
jgi:hypothetical protein